MHVIFRMQRRLIAWILLLACGPAAAYAQLNWTPHGTPVLSAGSGSAWDSAFLLAPSVVRHGNIYMMWYSGSPDFFNPGAIAIGLATSPDGLAWTKHPGNPVMEGRAEAWDQPGVFISQVIADGDTLRMWYAAGDAPEGARTGYATSVDGIHWDLRAGPVMETGPAGTWNEDIMWPGSVLKEDGVFKMWFTGGVGVAQRASEFTKTGIGYATSPDGIRWTIHDDPATTAPPYHVSDPVLTHGPAGAWDANEMFTPSVLRTELGYEMWYSGWRFGARQHIGYATSPDGIHWTKHEDNPIFQAPGSANPGLVFPAVLKEGAIYRMWFQGWRGLAPPVIGYAESPATATSGEVPPELPAQIVLHANYPNPFGTSTTIPYDVPHTAHVTLLIYDALGRQVRTLVDAVQPAGKHTAVWKGHNDSGEGLASGVYLVRMQVDKAVQNRVLLLTK